MPALGRFLDPSLIARTYRDPVAWAALGIDLLPVYGVVALGWGAAGLVMLYWLENLVIGLVALARMLAVGARGGLAGIAGVTFLGAFFTFHYGMFCFVHGVFLNSFISMSDPGNRPNDFQGPFELVGSALGAAPFISSFMGLILIWQAFLFVWDFLRGGEVFETEVMKEMFLPYGRIIVLHIGIFAGAGAAVLLGEPMWGVLGLIVLRALWGAILSMLRRLRLDGN